MFSTKEEIVKNVRLLNRSKDPVISDGTLFRQIVKTLITKAALSIIKAAQGEIIKKIN